MMSWSERSCLKCLQCILFTAAISSDFAIIIKIPFYRVNTPEYDGTLKFVIKCHLSGIWTCEWIISQSGRHHHSAMTIERVRGREQSVNCQSVSHSCKQHIHPVYQTFLICKYAKVCVCLCFLCFIFYSKVIRNCFSHYLFQLALFDKSVSYKEKENMTWWFKKICCSRAVLNFVSHHL